MDGDGALSPGEWRCFVALASDDAARAPERAAAQAAVRARTARQVGPSVGLV